MNPRTALLLGSIFNLAFVVFHLLFWRIFHWRRDLRSLLPVNRAIMQVLNLCLTFAFAVFAIVSAFHGADMTGTALGRTLLALISLFWFVRAIEQVVFFERTRLSAAFVVVFLLGTSLYAYVWASA